ncbi:hypothetical protein G7Y79_00044g080360 [Physcia stellaris]|nr:hypothetical protein G7Y79_00044g080360 [Physcia stellaris]
MQLTLDLGLPTTARSRGAANRHAKEREKRGALQKLTPTSTSTFTSAAASIEISAPYECHSMTVTPQTPVEFREPHYTINGRNGMTLDRQEPGIYPVPQPAIIQDPMTKARPMFDVAFDVSKVKTHTRSQVESQQKLLQKDQEAWEGQIFQYFWRLERSEIIRINGELSSDLEYRLGLSGGALFQEHFRFQPWTERSVWSGYAHCKFKKYYSPLSTAVRANDEEKIRLHMREEIVRHSSRFLLKSLTKYACNAMQRKRWKLDPPHNIPTPEEAQLAKDIKRAKKANERVKAEATRIEREKHSAWPDEPDDSDESDDTYMTDESIDSDNRSDDDEGVQWSELVELRTEADEHKWKQKRELYSSMPWSI